MGGTYTPPRVRRVDLFIYLLPRCARSKPDGASGHYLLGSPLSTLARHTGLGELEGHAIVDRAPELAERRGVG